MRIQGEKSTEKHNASGKKNSSSQGKLSLSLFTVSMYVHFESFDNKGNW